MRYLIFILVLASIAYTQAPPIEPGVSLDLAKWRAARYSDIRYKLNLTLEKMSPVLKGSIEIQVKVAEFGDGMAAPPPIVLDWRKVLGHESDSTISNVELNNQEARSEAIRYTTKGGSAQTYKEDAEHLIFDNHIASGYNYIRLDFTSPILTSGSAITRYVDKEDGSEYIYSLFVPSDASTAFPCFDQPDLKGIFELSVSHPQDWTVVSNSMLGRSMIEHSSFVQNGELLGQTSFADAFDETKPISTYVFAFAAGPFLVSLSTGGFSATASVKSSSHIYVRKSQGEKFRPHAAEVAGLRDEAVKYLEEYFDYKFPFPKYDLVLIPEFPFGGMEHAGATFLREDRIIFPQEPTRNDYITRANVIFHETAHQWFGDTVTMKWFDDLWLKEGFAEFMAYKTMEHVMPEYNAWKVFYERNKQAAYLTDSTKGTTPIYQPIANLSAAKSAYGNIVYRKAPSFLRQAEFYLGEDKFQTAVRAFLKKHEFANASWEDLVGDFVNARKPRPDGLDPEKVIIGERTDDMDSWAKQWVKVAGVPIIRTLPLRGDNACYSYGFVQTTVTGEPGYWREEFLPLIRFADGQNVTGGKFLLLEKGSGAGVCDAIWNPEPIFLMPNYRDFGYGIFLFDDKSRDYVLKNIQNEKDDFLRSMMWGSLWDSVREAELDPKDYVELVIRVLSSNFSLPPASKKPAKAGTQNAGTPNISKRPAEAGTQNEETDETTIATLLSRVTTAVNYYLSDTQRAAISPRLEELLLDKLQHASTPGQRITYYRAFVNTASSAKAHDVLKQMLEQASAPVGKTAGLQPRTKDKFEIVTRLIILGDPEAPKLLANLEKTETGDDAKRYAYAARAAFGTAENKAKYWNDFVNNKDISESWIESAILSFNTLRQSDLTLPYLERSLAELPNLKRSRKIFFVNNWLGAFIAGQRSEQALAIVNKFLANNPNLDNDLRLKILENVDLIERAVKIRHKFAGK